MKQLQLFHANGKFFSYCWGEWNNNLNTPPNNNEELTMSMSASLSVSTQSNKLSDSYSTTIPTSTIVVLNQDEIKYNTLTGTKLSSPTCSNVVSLLLRTKRPNLFHSSRIILKKII
jgi:hypothetical protein